MQVLLIGGAGYIGSNTVARLIEKKHKVVILDNFPSPINTEVDFIKGDVEDDKLLDHIFSTRHIDVVMHFASYKQVEESVLNPAKYYANNLIKTINLLNVMVKNGVLSLVFCSSSSVYGNPQYLPIDENHPLQPINPYGRSKLMVEQILADYHTAYGFKSVSLRPFNAAGGDMLIHRPSTYLFPRILKTLKEGTREITVYGNDLNTNDGSSIRDYLHVRDIAEAFTLAASALFENMKLASAYNIGSGRGNSVYEIIQAFNRITGKNIAVIKKPPRLGDPLCLVADNGKAIEDLNWQLSYSDLDTIIETAYKESL